MLLNKLARYPFLKESAAYLKDNGPTLNELIYDIAYERTRAEGKKRVLEAMEHGEIKDHSFTSDAERLTELLSYITARILVSCINDPYLIRRYSLAEAKLAYQRLKEDDLRFVVEVANTFGLDVSVNDGKARIQFISYLINTSQIRSLEWKMVNQELENGLISLDKTRLSRAVQNALQRKLENDFPADVNEDILKAFEENINEIKGMVESKKRSFEPVDMGGISVTKLPPCIRRLLAMVQAGENLSHSGRFALTTFLHTIGMSNEEILKMFATSPDFDESKSMYQVEHITGKISGTEYTPPECSTMKSYGICFGEDNLCRKDWMTHPMKYYRVKDKSAKKRTSTRKEEEKEMQVNEPR